MNALKSSVIQFCADIGKDSLLVQGAGGNASWKEKETLWIKASGTWLADAATDEIFLPVDLTALQEALNKENFSVKPTPLSASALKPSIETLLHALMPHPVVVHLHAVDVLAYLVRRECDSQLRSLLGDLHNWLAIDYFKPGQELAQAVKSALDDQPDVNIIFLKNHGVVIGGANIFEIRQTLNSLHQRLSACVQKLHVTAPPISDEYRMAQGYIPVDDAQLHWLALDTELYDRLQSDWILYPDHAVFLGSHAYRYDSFDALKNSGANSFPELIFVRDNGVFVRNTFGKTKLVQLRCYYDVLIRQPGNAKLATLSDKEIVDLLGRDDEKYRIGISRQ